MAEQTKTKVIIRVDHSTNRWTSVPEEFTAEELEALKAKLTDALKGGPILEIACEEYDVFIPAAILKDSVINIFYPEKYK